MGAHGCNRYCRSDILHRIQSALGILDEEEFEQVMREAFEAMSRR